MINCKLDWFRFMPLLIENGQVSSLTRTVELLGEMMIRYKSTIILSSLHNVFPYCTIFFPYFSPFHHVRLKDLDSMFLKMLIVGPAFRKTGDTKPRFKRCTMFPLLNLKKLKKVHKPIDLNAAILDIVCFLLNHAAIASHALTMVAWNRISFK